MLKVINSRQSVRAWTGEKGPAAVLEKIVKAWNRQPWQFVAATEKELLKKTLLSVLLFTSVFAPRVHAQAVNEGVFAKDRLKYVLGQDGVTPIPVKLRNGKEVFLWTFGDTILGEWKGAVNATATLNFSEIADMKAMPPNSLAMSPAPDDSNYKELKFEYFTSSGAAVRDFIPYYDNESPRNVRLWADSGIALGGAVYVYYMYVEITEDQTAFPFKFTETGLARWDITEGLDIKKADFKRVPNFAIKDMVVGDGVVRGPGNYLSIVGRCAKKPGEALASLCFMRVKPGDIEKASAYEYLTASGTWGAKDPGLFFNDVCGEASLSYDRGKKEYTVIYMSGASQEIVMVTFKNFAALPAGYKKTVVYKPAVKKSVLYYSAKEIFRTGSFIYIIYIDPGNYQPILIKLPL